MNYFLTLKKTSKSVFLRRISLILSLKEFHSGNDDFNDGIALFSYQQTLFN